MKIEINDRIAQKSYFAAKIDTVFFATIVALATITYIVFKNTNSMLACIISLIPAYIISFLAIKMKTKSMRTIQIFGYGVLNVILPKLCGNNREYIFNTKLEKNVKKCRKRNIEKNSINKITNKLLDKIFGPKGGQNVNK